ncbi:MAG: CYTH and CHAD domain-containing protein [Neomegalonema sp.]|nr:CYTH and CHAD domain-containing protein [Neomegalonema sp.]
MGDDGREYELKIALSPIALSQLALGPALRLYQVSEPKTRALRSVYFDTPHHGLRQERIALRLRQVDGRWVQTVKHAPEPIRNGISNPLESEVQVGEPVPQIESIEPKKLRRQVQEITSRTTLQPIFETQIKRSEVQWRLPAELCGGDRDSRVLICLDQGHVEAQGRKMAVGEVEIELIEGEIAAVFVAARMLFAGRIVSLSTHSKASLGYALLSGGLEPPQVQRAGAVALTKSSSAGVAFEAILRSASAQITANLPLMMPEQLGLADNGAVKIDRAEAVHQFRVGVRRLRSALKLHRPLLERRKVRAIESQARDIFRIVGALRDADVLHDEILAPSLFEDNDIIRASDLEALRALVATRKADLRTSLPERLSAERVGAFVFDLLALIETRSWEPQATKKQNRSAQPARAFAAEILQEAWEEAQGWGDHLGRLTIVERHEMRKALKTLRYGCDFYKPLFAGEKCETFLAHLRKLQNVFGFLNDLAMAEQLVTLAPGHRGVRAVIAHHHALSEKAWTKAQRRWGELEAVPVFWR